MADQRDILDRLRRAVTTACNDDLSEVGSDKRDRHVERLTAMQDASGEIETLRRVIYKAQTPENANKFWSEFLTDDEKVAVRVAVSANI